MPLPANTRQLLERVEHGDREAAYDLVRIYGTDDFDDFVRFVYPDGPPPTWLFDTLADAFDAHVPRAA